jgi:hypothetical protein
MPEKRTIQRAVKAEKQGKAPTTQAGEFVREEMRHMRQGKHRVSSPRQAVAIGLSKARRTGVKVASPKRVGATEKTGQGTERAYRTGATRTGRKPATTRSRRTSQKGTRARTATASRKNASRTAQKSRRARRAIVPGRRRASAARSTRGRQRTQVRRSRA